MAVQGFSDLIAHVGHAITCTLSKTINPEGAEEDNVTLLCEDCGMVLACFNKEEDCVEWSVWQLTIVQPGTILQYTFDNKDTAVEQLYRYVFDNWAEAFPTTACPKSATIAINKYFAAVRYESYTLYEQPVLCEPERLTACLESIG